jgi:hypothetical protein
MPLELLAVVELELEAVAVVLVVVAAVLAPPPEPVVEPVVWVLTVLPQAEARPRHVVRAPRKARRAKLMFRLLRRARRRRGERTLIKRRFACTLVMWRRKFLRERNR